jgi:hypothetical protein
VEDMKVQEKETKKFGRRPLMKTVEKFGLYYIADEE